MKNKRVIFIVEDDKFYNSTLSAYLTIKGNTVYSFFNGEACLEKTDLKPDIVFLDYILEGIDGLEVMRRMKPQCNRTEFIFLSGQTDIKVVLDTMHQGAYDYIIKDNHAKENALNKIDQITRYRKICKEKEMYKKSIIIMVSGLILSWVLLFAYYQFYK
jgi:FixJ family two-component response regulator